MLYNFVFLPSVWYDLIISVLLLLPPALVAQDTARFIGLGHLPGGSSSMAFDVSANGLVVVGRDGGVGSVGIGFRWTEEGGITELPFFPNATQSNARGVSGDGSVIVGYAVFSDGSFKALRWAGGTVSALPSLPVDPPVREMSIAQAISYDGTIIVGVGTNNLNKNEALMWVGGGLQILGHLPGGNSSSAADISYDGSVIVGSSELYYSQFQKYNLAFRRVGGGALQSLGTGGYYSSVAYGVSKNGEVIVGALIEDDISIAARWTASGGWEPLQGTTGSSNAYGASADGDIIVGLMEGKAFIWDADSSARDLKKVLENEYHLDLTGWILSSATAIDSSGTAIVGYGNHNAMTEAWYVKLPRLKITKPILNSLWIAGEKDTIKWSGGKKNQILSLSYSIDSSNTFNLIDFIPSGDTGVYVWDIPINVLSKKCMIRVMDFNDPTVVDTSDVFKIKPYILTRDSSGQYEPYRTEEDQWEFWNNSVDMFPQTWYQQFDYQGIDPFTNLQYSQWQGGFVFASSISAEFPDWVSWVNTFGIDACYDLNPSLGLYDPTALQRWDAVKGNWKGSCFGIAASNALAFSYKGQFQTKYNNIFPLFVNPILVLSNDGVKTVINELYTHQFGNPSKQFLLAGWNSVTPNQTLNELKEMFREDNAATRTLAIENNNGAGAHCILPYKLQQDFAMKNLYYLFVYDNSYPTSFAVIKIDTLGNSNNGVWTPLYGNYPNWGGPKYLYLTTESNVYFNNAALPKKTEGYSSPFVMSSDEVEVYTNIDANTKIKDTLGNVTGYSTDSVLIDIPNSIPMFYLDGSETPPYGYSLPTDNYSVIVDNFASDTIKTFFFTGNKTFTYKRYDADQTQTDRLFFDGGVSVTNPDQQSKTISLLNIINETTQEKLFAFSSMELAENDSVKIENPDSNKIKLRLFGTAKDYDIEINYVNENGIGRFGDFDVPLEANTSHTFVPDWSDVTNTDLMVLVDNGNNGTIDDTLYLENQVTGIGDDQGSLLTPTNYNLAQNYPNPFNPVTTIQYSLTQRSNVTLKVYDVLGKEIAVLVNEEKDRGVYNVNFDATGLASGMYMYRIQAGSFAETKKMILLR